MAILIQLSSPFQSDNVQMTKLLLLAALQSFSTAVCLIVKVQEFSLDLFLNACLAHICMPLGPFTFFMRFVKWKHLPRGGDRHAVSNYITLGFSDTFCGFASLCFFLTRWIHFCRLFLAFFSQVDSLLKNGNDSTQVAARLLWPVARVSWVVTRELSGGVWVWCPF